MKWKSLSGGRIDDIHTFAKDVTRLGQELHIGCDSLQTGRFTQYVTVVVVHTPGKGGRVIYTREVVPRITSLRERLFGEVWRSIQVAMDLSPIISGPLSVHIDANTDEKYMSSRYVQELTGLVMGQGFKAVLKPESWAATHTADHVVRLRNFRAIKSDGLAERRGA